MLLIMQGKSRCNLASTRRWIRHSTDAVFFVGFEGREVPLLLLEPAGSLRKTFINTYLMPGLPVPFTKLTRVADAEGRY